MNDIKARQKAWLDNVDRMAASYGIPRAEAMRRTIASNAPLHAELFRAGIPAPKASGVVKPKTNLDVERAAWLASARATAKSKGISIAAAMSAKVKASPAEHARLFREAS